MVVQELGPENAGLDLVQYGALPPEAVHRTWKAMELVKEGAYILPNYEPGNNPMIAIKQQDPVVNTVRLLSQCTVYVQRICQVIWPAILSVIDHRLK